MTRAVLALSLVALVGCKPDPCPEEDQKTFYADADGDGFGSMTLTIVTCDAFKPDGFLTDNTDCDDLDAGAFPGSPEVCDGADNDCDGTADGDGATGTYTFFADTDGDGFGDADTTVQACDQPTNFVDNDADCDDANADNSPLGIETCDGKDNDCNGEVDVDALDSEIWHADFDGDGFGNPDYAITSCGNPEGYVQDTSDCDDQNPSVWPGQVEVCNGLDDNCDGSTDPITSVGVGTWFADADGDGFADDDAPALTQCIQPAGSVLVKGDCADDNKLVFPGAVETCDGSDNDCSGTIDWGLRVPDDYAALNDALGAAADGETVCVAAGTYIGNFDTNGVSVTIQGEGSATTILDGGSAGSVFTVKNGESVVLSGVTLQNGKANKGAALYVSGSVLDADDLTITGNTIAPSLTGTNQYSYGVIYLTGAEVSFTDVDVIDHTLTIDFSTTGSALTTSNTSVSNYLYGALLYTTGSVLQWDGGSLSNNTVSTSHYGRPTTYTSTAFAYNYMYGGLGYLSGTILALSDVEIADNTISAAPTVTTTGSSYAYNYGYGELIYSSSSLISGDSVDIDANTITATSEGNTYGYNYRYGVIYGTGTTWTLSDFNLTDTDWKSTGYQAYAFGVLYNSGGISWDDSSFSDNEIVVDGNQFAYLFTIYHSGGNFVSDGLTVDNNVFQLKNSGTGSKTTSSSFSAYCYGMYLYHYGYSVDLEHFTYTNNSVDCAPKTTSTYHYEYVFPPVYLYYGYGGSGGQLTNAIIANNTVTSGYYAYYGFVSQQYYTDLEVTNTSISNNTLSAPSFGSNYSGTPSYGALYNFGYYDTLTMVNTSIDNNTFTSTNSSFKAAAVLGYYPTTSYSGGVDISYSNFYDNSDDLGVLYIGSTATDPEGTDGNIDEDPAYVDAAGSDFTLDSSSLLIDAGDPAIEDYDTTTSDIGAYGGPGADW